MPKCVRKNCVDLISISAIWLARNKIKTKTQKHITVCPQQSQNHARNAVNRLQCHKHDEFISICRQPLIMFRIIWSIWINSLRQTINCIWRRCNWYGSNRNGWANYGKKTTKFKDFMKNWSIADKIMRCKNWMQKSKNSNWNWER